MNKTVEILIYDKEDYFSFGDWCEVEDFIKDSKITEREFYKLQRNVNKTTDTIILTEDEKDINEFIKDPEDSSTKIFNKISEYLDSKYELPITVFKTKIVSIK